MSGLFRKKEFLHQPIAELGTDPLPPLPSEEERNPDGKSLINPPRADGALSAAYTTFPDPIDSSNNGFDFHIYYIPSNKEEAQYARDLHERIRREFPEPSTTYIDLHPSYPWMKPSCIIQIKWRYGAKRTDILKSPAPSELFLKFEGFQWLGGYLRIYRFWDKAVGPHPTAMFEVNTFNPHQTGALFSWLTVYRGPCSVLIHPNTDDEYKDHTELMSWMGRPWPLNL